MNERFLVRIDFQNDFAAPEGALTINNPDLIARHQRFADSLQKGMFSEIWDFRDTHFAETYPQTKEAESFPLHTEFGSWGWQPAAILKDNIPVRTFFKSTTNLWNEVNQYALLQQDLRDKEVYLCVLEDLCQGAVRQIPEIISEPKYGRLLEEGRLRHITGAQFFRSILLEKKLNYNLVNSSRGK